MLGSLAKAWYFRKCLVLQKMLGTSEDACCFPFCLLFSFLLGLLGATLMMVASTRPVLDPGPRPLALDPEPARAWLNRVRRRALQMGWAPKGTHPGKKRCVSKLSVQTNNT